jgi:hypothetical protein
MEQAREIQIMLGDASLEGKQNYVALSFYRKANHTEGIFKVALATLKEKPLEAAALFLECNRAFPREEALKEYEKATAEDNTWHAVELSIVLGLAPPLDLIRQEIRKELAKPYLRDCWNIYRWFQKYKLPMDADIALQFADGLEHVSSQWHFEEGELLAIRAKLYKRGGNPERILDLIQAHKDTEKLKHILELYQIAGRDPDPAVIVQMKERALCSRDIQKHLACCRYLKCEPSKKEIARYAHECIKKGFMECAIEAYEAAGLELPKSHARAFITSTVSTFWDWRSWGLQRWETLKKVCASANVSLTEAQALHIGKALAGERHYEQAGEAFALAEQLRKARKT